VYNSGGDIVMIDGKYKQYLYDFNINEPINSVKIDHNSTRLYVGSQKGQVYVFDLRMRRVID